MWRIKWVTTARLSTPTSPSSPQILLLLSPCLLQGLALPSLSQLSNAHYGTYSFGNVVQSCSLRGHRWDTPIPLGPTQLCWLFVCSSLANRERHSFGSSEQQWFLPSSIFLSLSHLALPRGCCSSGGSAPIPPGVCVNTSAPFAAASPHQYLCFPAKPCQFSCSKIQQLFIPPLLLVRVCVSRGCRRGRSVPQGWLRSPSLTDAP